ncbi:F-box domain-containing protein [Fusarium oxysporum f. sp. albedinis]|nr:F-box domain-containing protein [Fusarium oxysporum f. sp. albedinis]
MKQKSPRGYQLSPLHITSQSRTTPRPGTRPSSVFCIRWPLARRIASPWLSAEFTSTSSAFIEHCSNNIRTTISLRQKVLFRSLLKNGFALLIASCTLRSPEPRSSVDRELPSGTSA